MSANFLTNSSRYFISIPRLTQKSIKIAEFQSFHFQPDWQKIAMQTCRTDWVLQYFSSTRHCYLLSVTWKTRRSVISFVLFIACLIRGNEKLPTEFLITINKILDLLYKFVQDKSLSIFNHAKFDNLKLYGFYLVYF